MSMTSRIYDSARQRDGEQLRRDGWRNGILAVSVIDITGRFFLMIWRRFLNNEANTASPAIRKLHLS